MKWPVMPVYLIAPQRIRSRLEVSSVAVYSNRGGVLVAYGRQFDFSRQRAMFHGMCVTISVRHAEVHPGSSTERLHALGGAPE